MSVRDLNICEHHKGYNITFEFPPVPSREYDYMFMHEDFDVDDNRVGFGPTVTDCIRQIDEIIEEEIVDA